VRICLKTDDPLETVNNKIDLECSETYISQAGRSFDVSFKAHKNRALQIIMLCVF
jgi:hypothetical protein